MLLNLITDKNNHPYILLILSLFPTQFEDFSVHPSLPLHPQPHRDHINQRELQYPREHGGFDVLAFFVGIEDDEDVGFFGKWGFGRCHADDGGAVGFGLLGGFDEFGRLAGAGDE